MFYAGGRGGERGERGGFVKRRSFVSVNVHVFFFLVFLGGWEVVVAEVIVIGRGYFFVCCLFRCCWFHVYAVFVSQAANT